MNTEKTKFKERDFPVSQIIYMGSTSIANINVDKQI